MLPIIVTCLLVFGCRAKDLGQYRLPPRPDSLNSIQQSPQLPQTVQQYLQPFQPSYLPSQTIQTVQQPSQLPPIPPVPTAPPQISLAPTLSPNTYPNAIQNNLIPYQYPTFAPSSNPLAPSPFPSSGCTLGCPQPQYVMGTDGNYYQHSGQSVGTEAAAGTGTGVDAAAGEEATTKGPPNRFNEAGWETDDNGNVYVGNDDAKLYLISVGSFWPFPKDYRKKRSLPGPSLEQLLGFSKM